MGLCAASVVLGVAGLAPVELPSLEAAPKLNLFSRKAKPATKPTPSQAAAISNAANQQAQNQAERQKQADAVQPVAGTIDPDASLDAEVPGDNRVRLMYVDMPWSMVLRNFAKETGTELVADRVPKRTWTRLDRREYTIPEALRILNKELEPQGFRLVVKGRHLVLIDIPSTRPEYARPYATPAAGQFAATRPMSETSDKIAAALQTRPTQPAAGGVVTADRAEVVDLSPRRTPNVRTVAGEAEPSPATPPANNPPALEAPRPMPAATSPAAPRGTPARAELVLEHQDALDVAKAMRTAFGKQAELLATGPDNLPAFQVYRNAEGGAVWFQIGIDEDKNRLVIAADAADVVAVKKLIQALDAPAGRVGRTLKPMATPIPAAPLARVLEQPVKQLAQANRAADAQEAIDPNAPPAAAPIDPNSLPDLLGALKGEVAVESVPDLGVLILRGNQKDVDAVMQIIREIERLSVGATPDLQLVLLENVNSEGLAELLTTIYDRLRSSRTSVVQQSQSVSVIPIVRPNAVLVLASSADMESVLKLVKELDQPIDSQTEFRVLKLKHAVATQVATTLDELYPPLTQQTQQQRAQPGLVPRIRISSDVRTNAVIIQARPRDLAEISALVESLDSSESATVSQVRIIQLKSALADEVAETLQTAIQSVLNPPRTNTTTGGQGGLGGGINGGGGGGTAGGSAELRAVKSTVLQFLSPDGDGAARLRSGILADIRISSDVRTNSLVVTAPEESLPLLEALIQQLDRPAATVAEIKVFALTKADATTSAELLQQLFNQSSQTQRQGANGRGGAVGSVPGLQVQGADDASSTLIPLRFSVDVRTNSIIAIGGAEALRVVEAVLLRLDDSDVRQRESIVYRLKNSYAPDVQSAISRFLQSRRQIETTDSGLVSPFEQIEREVVVEAEAATNSLLISATPRYFEEIKNLVEKLDAAPLQVVIQALLVEVTLDNTDEFGVELGFQDSVLFDRSIVSQVLQVPTTTTSPNGVQTTTQSIISRTVAPGFNFNNQQFGQNPINQGQVGKQSLTNFAVGRVNGDLGYGGLVLSAGSESVNVLLRALSVSRRVDVLTRPQIRTLDNQTAQIQVGQQVPIVDGVNTGIAGNAQPIVRQDQAGIILTVTPRITPDQTVVMEVVAEKSAFTGAGVPIFTDATTGNVIESPIKDITNARAVVAIRDNQTIVLGGMITRSQEDETRKVPLLGDIPIIGLAFRYDFHSHRRTELLIFLTPRVIRTDEDNELVKQIETQRIHFTETDAEEMHGPILSVPGSDPNCPPEMLPGEELVVPPGATWNEHNLPVTVLPAIPPEPMGVTVPEATLPPVKP